MAKLSIIEQLHFLFKVLIAHISILQSVLY